MLTSVCTCGGRVWQAIVLAAPLLADRSLSELSLVLTTRGVHSLQVRGPAAPQWEGYLQWCQEE